MRRPGALLTILGGLAVVAAPAVAMQVDANAAWGGWSRPGRVTESQLQLRSPSGTRADVTITTGGQVVHTTVQLAAGEPARLSVPTLAAERVTVRVASPGSPPEQAEIRLALAEAPLLAWAGPAAPGQAAAGFQVVPVGADALPRNPAAYAGIDALVVDQSVIGELEEGQLSALLSFMAGCGRTVLISGTPGAAALLLDAVGCGGRNFAVSASVEDAVASLGRILDSQQSELPRAATLAALGGHELDAWHLAVAVLAVGIAVTLLAAIFSGSFTASVLVPAVAAAAGLAFMQTRPVNSELLVWSETRSSDRLARYRGLQRVVSTRRGDIEVPIMSVLTGPQACDADDHVDWTWDAAKRRHVAARITGRLFTAASFCYAGAFPVTRAAVGGQDAAGNILLRNSGQAAWPAGTLVWDGRVQPSPPVRPGGQWSLREKPADSPVSAAQREAVARAPVDGMVILWPLDLGVVEPAPTAAQAWLLLQVGSESGA